MNTESNTYIIVIVIIVLIVLVLHFSRDWIGFARLTVRPLVDPCHYPFQLLFDYLQAMCYMCDYIIIIIKRMVRGVNCATCSK